jgi:hypothetical protein
MNRKGVSVQGIAWLTVDLHAVCECQRGFAGEKRWSFDKTAVGFSRGASPRVESSEGKTDH